MKFDLVYLYKLRDVGLLHLSIKIENIRFIQQPFKRINKI